ncbi:hypothetical protein I3842_08G071800 [Carya illinoinensis]|uniref:Uncharacterized protein n=1 Tax=Carya illinoinensis TaxID=32201 RepID=A0A922E9R9_CARIL|nr:hypothetical protein I3842_08G071800 [Carya illinoinensis]
MEDGGVGLSLSHSHSLSSAAAPRSASAWVSTLQDGGMFLFIKPFRSTHNLFTRPYLCIMIHNPNTDLHRN